jgi:hypothetical protein
MPFREPSPPPPDPEVRACPTCGAEVEVRKAYYDPRGNLVCKPCFDAGQVSAAFARIDESTRSHRNDFAIARSVRAVLGLIIVLIVIAYWALKGR